jgi:predicted DNA binding protein
MILKDIGTLALASEEDKSAIMGLRDKLECTRIEKLRSKEILINYKLKIRGLKHWYTSLSNDRLKNQ